MSKNLRLFSLPVKSLYAQNVVGLKATASEKFRKLGDDVHGSFGLGQDSKQEVSQNLSRFFVELTCVKCLFQYSVCLHCDWPIGQLCQKFNHFWGTSLVILNSRFESQSWISLCLNVTGVIFGSFPLRKACWLINISPVCSFYQIPGTVTNSTQLHLDRCMSHHF